MGYSINPKLIKHMRHHAIEAYPDEALGAVINGKYVPLENKAEDKKTSGSYDPIVLARLRLSGQLEALFHSHPHTPEHPAPNAPSRNDMIAQLAEAIPFIILWTNGQVCAEPFCFGDQCEIPKLVGRTFRHGVTDCYSLIRDYYRIERNELLPEYPRDWNWWLKGDNLYEDNFRKAGFEEVDSPEVGDVALFSIRSKVANHGGVYYGAGVLLHHATAWHEAWDPSRFSRREPIGRWLPYKTHWLRRRQKADD